MVKENAEIYRMDVIVSTTVTRFPGNTVLFMIPHGDPFGYKHAIEAEERIRNRSSKDPEQAPRREPGDKYVILGTVLGISIGCLVGFIIGSSFFGIGGVFVGLIGGAVFGGFIGLTIGSYIKKRVNSPRRKKAETGEERPFIR